MCGRLEIVKKRGKGNVSATACVVGNEPVDPESAGNRADQHLRYRHCGLADHMSYYIANSPLTAQRRSIPLERSQVLQQLAQSFAFRVDIGPNIDSWGHDRVLPVPRPPDATTGQV